MLTTLNSKRVNVNKPLDDAATQGQHRGHVLTYNLTLQVIASQWLPFGHFLEYLSERALIGTGSTLLNDVFGEQSGDLFDHCCRDALINRYSFAIRDLLDVSMNRIG